MWSAVQCSALSSVSNKIFKINANEIRLHVHLGGGEALTNRPPPVLMNKASS